MSNFEIVHYTSAKNIEGILFSRKILNNESINKLRSHNIVEGEGGFNRVLCEPDVYVNGFDAKSKCGEAYGIFCRIKNLSRPFIPYNSRDFKTNIKLPQRGKVAIILHSYILNDYTWHFNYCENNGFYVSNTPDGGFYAPFGVGECYENSTKQIQNIENAVQNNLILNYSDTELVIHNDIDLYKGDYVKDIIDHNGKSILYKYNARKRQSKFSRRVNSRRSLSQKATSKLSRNTRRSI